MLDQAPIHNNLHFRNLQNKLKENQISVFNVKVENAKEMSAVVKMGNVKENNVAQMWTFVPLALATVTTLAVLHAKELFVLFPVVGLTS